MLLKILETINSRKFKVAENDSAYPKMYVLIPRTQLYRVCEPRYEMKRVLVAILAAILNFDRKPLFIKRLPSRTNFIVHVFTEGVFSFRPNASAWVIAIAQPSQAVRRAKCRRALTFGQK